MFPAGSFRHKSMRPPGEYGSNHDLMGSRVSPEADISAFFLFSLLQFLPVSCIIIYTWPVSQTVKTLRSQRREYGFESHTGHQSESASIRKDRGAFCMTGEYRDPMAHGAMPMRESQLPFKETHTAQVPCKGSCRRPWRASSAVSKGGAAWSQGGRWLLGYHDFRTAKKHPSGSTR